MLLIKILAFAQFALGAPAAEFHNQYEIDESFRLIFKTEVGMAVCTRILGADPKALEFHLGISPDAAVQIARHCHSPGKTQPWLFPSKPMDIRKFTLCQGDTGKPCGPRKYFHVETEKLYPIESWTDPYTNTTVLLTRTSSPKRTRLVQLLAHEMAVYFDSKATPTAADAQNIPALAGLKIRLVPQPITVPFSPWVALLDPLTAHTLTFLRALRIERSIVKELADRHLLEPPADDQDPYVAHLLSDECSHDCILQLIQTMRDTYSSLSLPLLAYAPTYRSQVIAELANIEKKYPGIWGSEKWPRANKAIQYTVAFFENRSADSEQVKSDEKLRLDSLANLQRLYPTLARESDEFELVGHFLSDDLWRPLELPSLNAAKLSDGQTLLEFMKQPLLSGYNVLLSSGPRVRIHGGGE